MQTSLDIAQAYGLPLRQKGSKHWACCPLHGEKTASMCFFPDGRWYCFGCHQHGDAVDLYAALYGVSIGEALKVLKGDQPKRQAARRPRLQDVIEAWYQKAWSKACDDLHHASAAMSKAQNDSDFGSAAAIKAEATDFLNLLECATPKMLLHMYWEDKSNDERLRPAES